MNYPEPAGTPLLYQPSFNTVTRILARSRRRYVGEGPEEKQPRKPHGGKLEAYLNAMRERGGWITAPELAIEMDASLSYVQNSLSRYVRHKQLQRRFRPDGTREYGQI